MEAKTRIITHMNKEHQDTIVRLLEHFYGFSSYAARNARLYDMTLHTLYITTSPSSGSAKKDNYVVTLYPPLGSWGEARERLAALDKRTVTGLGREPVTLKRYIPPKGLHLIVGITCLLVYIVLGRRANLSPATCPKAIKPWLERYPAVAEFLWNIQPKAFYPLVGIHIVELLALARLRLTKYSVPVGSGLWWKWIIGTFIEGFGSFQRIDNWAAKEKATLAKAKH